VISSRLTLATALLFSAVAACRETPRGTPAPVPTPNEAGPVSKHVALPADRFSDEGKLAEGARYLDDDGFRREVLVESLVNPTNTYSRQRLDAYGLKTKGWDLLPAWNPQTIPVTTAMAADLRAGRAPTVEPTAPRLWDGKRPTTVAEWVTLGREVFFGYPLRVEVFMDFALKHPEIGEKVGVRAGADGVYPGVRAFVDLHGKTALGITCAVCHTSVAANGDVIVGEARRAFDYGALRLAYHSTLKVPVDPDLARRMKTWGPGRADVTEDDDEDPVAIPDLWGLQHQSTLTQAGTIKHVGPTALAIRQETQLLHSNHQKIRPPRELSWALAMFLYSLSPPSPKHAADPKLVERGAALFGTQCKGCHSNPAFGGAPVTAERVGTDRALALGGARGTGTYRPPALLAVSAAAPYFHHGAVPSLEDVLSPDRLAATYTRSPLGRGPVPGHPYGTDLPHEDRTALVAWLRTL
jgi:cytochrome c5